MTFLTSIASALAHALPSTRANRLLILIYHRVHAQPDPMFPGEVDAERFDWQMALLRRYCSPIGLSDGVARLRDGTLPARAVAITFDDGYADNALIAFPTLRRHAVPATFFVATAFIDGGRMWNDTVIEAVRRANCESLDLSDLGLPVEALGDTHTRVALAEKIIRSVKHLHPLERLAKVQALSERIGAPLPDDLMMTSAHVRALAHAGMEVGAHTVNHPILRSLSIEEVTAEVSGNRARLEQITGRRVASFAYPNGRPGDDYTQRDRDIVAALGFDYAVSTVRGATTSQSDPFQMPRFNAWARRPDRWLGRLLLGFARPR